MVPEVEVGEGAAGGEEGLVRLLGASRQDKIRTCTEPQGAHIELAWADPALFCGQLISYPSIRRNGIRAMQWV